MLPVCLSASSHKPVSTCRSNPAMEIMACGTRLASSCIASARTRTTLRQSSKPSIPENQIALYSPRESPATAEARSTTSGFSRRSFSNAQQFARNIAGWQYLVSSSLLSGPLRHKSRMSYPRMLHALSMSLRHGSRSFTSASIFTYCDPWPGKRIATGNFLALASERTSTSGSTISGGSFEARSMAFLRQSSVIGSSHFFAHCIGDNS
mmetsp:Transcript_4118/g.9633  ORF Transcript_4118/g.9633 Transcript_4118/m.9633 type:complete len:208 (-) Transcript_4118:235-858(-)